MREHATQLIIAWNALLIFTWKAVFHLFWHLSLMIFVLHRMPCWERTGFYELDFSQPELSCIIHHLQGFIIKGLHKGLSCKTPRDLSGLWKRFYDVQDLGATVRKKNIFKCVAFWMPCILMKPSPPRAVHFTGHPLTLLWALASPTDSLEVIWSLFSISALQTDSLCFLHTHSPCQKPQCNFLSVLYTLV